MLQSNAPTKLNIGISGGSIAGCVAAILLGRAGHSVNVYERSKSGLIGRGGGVATSRKVIDEMRGLGLVAQDFPASFFDQLILSKTTDAHPMMGHSPFQPALDMHCVNWASLWETLRSHVPDQAYHRGEKLVHAHQSGDAVALEFASGRRESVDLLLFADGYQSYGRKLLFPEVKLDYCGYTVWRGVLPERDIADYPPHNGHPRISFKTEPGSYVSYVMPSYEGSGEPGERVINWACYIPVPKAELDTFMIDKDGVRRAGSIPGGAMRDAQEAELKAFARAQLPTYYADILERSTRTQIQLIFTDRLPAYRKGRMCLVGDAGMVVQPLTGSGLFKSLSNARDLVECLADGSVDAGLKKWSTRQTAVAQKMHDLGEQLEDAFIWNTIDLGTASQAECTAWWDGAVTIPEEFSYFALMR